MIEIFIADDHNLIREGLKKIIDTEPDMAVSGEAADASAIFDFFRQNNCDLLILDINLPDQSGLDVLKELKSMHKDLKALILSMYPEDRFAVRSLKAGANGYVTKESANTELIKAIRKVIQGRKYISESLAEQLAFGLDDDSGKSPHEKLSDREYQVLSLIGSGRGIQEISDRLSISVSTVNTYRSRILEKMDMKSNMELIHYCVKNNLVD